MNSLRVFFGFLMSVLLLTQWGCGNHPRNKDGSPVIEAYRLIDENREDEAIQLLENSLLKDPDNSEYKVVLASAYVQKSGIKLQKLIPLLKQIDFINQTAKSTEKREKKADKNGKAQADELLSVLDHYSAMVEAFIAIPLVKKDQAASLTYAIHLLDQVGTKISDEDALYRAVLEVLLFKYIASTELLVGMSGKTGTSDSQCFLDLENLNAVSLRLGKILIDIFTDIGIANPNQLKTMQTLIAKTTTLLDQMAVSTNSALVFDEATTVFLNQTLIQSALGKALKCSGK